MITITLPKLEHIVAHWNQIAPFLEKGIEFSNGEICIESIKEKLIDREIMLSVVFKDEQMIAAVTFEQITFDTGKRVLNIQLAGGDYLDEWFAQMEQLANDLAKHYSCEDIYIIGRKGWVKQMKRLGYSEVHTVLHKEVK